MNKNSFSKPPLTPEEKAKRADAFINQEDTLQTLEQEEGGIKKIPTKQILLRLPQTYIDDMGKIAALTGLSRNAICLELLRPAIRKKLKEIQEP